MSPQQKFEELRKDYSVETIIQVATTMILYYIGIGQNELQQFWREVGDIAKNNNE